MSQILIVASEDGVAYHRILAPVLNLNADVSHVPTLDIKDDLVELFSKFDTLFLSRILSADENQFEKIYTAIQETGIKLVVDIDDYWSLPPQHGLYKWYKQNKITYKIAQTLRLADVVITTHGRLANKVRELGVKEIVICPNAINLDHDQWKEPEYDRARFTVGWAGSSHHVMDLNMVRTSFMQLVDKEVGIVFGGYKDGYPQNYFEYILSANGKNPNYKRIHAMDVWNYGRMYDYMDVSIAPLKKDDFNMMKSELKAVEAGVKGCGFIASNIHPYTLICDSTNSILVDKPNDFYRAIMRYKNDPEMLTSHREKLKQDIKEKRNLTEINKIREEIL